MALNFPNNPSVNDTVELGGKTYQWDGVKWRVLYVVTPTAQALAPTITEVSTTETSITFTITNNDASTAVILYEVDDATPDENSVELAAAATSSNITITGLTGGTEYDVYATANVTGKVKSNVAELAIETDPPIVYTAATGGTTAEYDDGGTRYKSHTFNSSGTFTVTTVGNGDRNEVDYLIIAGGGGGGGSAGSGGGGAGGYRTTNGTSGANSSAESKVVVTAQGYTITVGAGGTGAANGLNNGSNASNSSSLGITSIGGGGGSFASNTPGAGGTAGTGGSGGGSGGNGTEGLGTTAQGFDGGTGDGSGAAGGGGGASQAGEDGVGATPSGDGGNGLANTLRTNSSETRSGGGGGGAFTSQGGLGIGTVVRVAGTGGSGGGGAGGDATDAFGQNATVNTGSGGGGAGYNDSQQTASGGNGGSGIVVIRYEIAPSV